MTQLKGNVHCGELAGPVQREREGERVGIREKVRKVIHKGKGMKLVVESIVLMRSESEGRNRHGESAGLK